MFFIFILLTCTTVTTLNLVHSLPIVDKGVFVITGVKTCGGGGGYCVLGQDCSVDKEFIADSNEGHCDGLRKAFTPRAFFVCCEYVDLALQTTTTTTTTTTPGSTVDPAINSDESAPENDDSAQSPESKESTSVESSESSDDKTNKTTTTTITTTSEVTTQPTTTLTSSTSKPALVTNIVSDQVFDDNAVGQEFLFDTTTQKINEITQSLPNKPATTTIFNVVNGVEIAKEDKTTVPVAAVVIHGVFPDKSNNVHNNHILNVQQDDNPQIKNEEEPSISQIDTTLNENKVTVTSSDTSDSVITQQPQATTLSSLLLSGGSGSQSSSSGVDEADPLQAGGGLQDGIPVETTTPQGIREKEHATTTVVSYSEKTEISMEQSVSLHVAQKQCGVKLSTSPRLDSPRLATATQSSSGTVQSCWTGAIVRSPTALSMQNDPGAFICTGALIHPSVLLTTATCVSRLFSQDLSLFKVALGSNRLLHPLSGPTPDADYRDIKSLVIHEDYAVDGHLRINDIALVMLSDPADMSRTCTLCLPDPESDFTGRECSVTGYSHPSDSSTMESDGLLHEADQRVEYQSHCESVIQSFRTEKELHGLLCASGKYSAEACFSPRDAGSPLACSQNGINFLVGSFSSGFHCGNELMPVLYTSIVNFVPWISKNLIKSVSVVF